MEKPVIMVVDNDDSLRTLLVTWLEEFGDYEIVEYENGELAWKTIKDCGWRTNLIIIDFEMPKMDGMELLNKVKKLYPEIGVIMMSGLSVATLALETGADAFLKKPFKLEWLQKTVQELLL